MDFADEENGTIIIQEILDANIHLHVIKSISKSYGVPGLRLGILASGDLRLVEELKKDVAIWNINSFGEFYMQIMEKYKRDYVNALALFREERTRFWELLGEIDGLRPIPSQANYVMVEVKGRVTSHQLTKIMLHKYNLLIKDLSGKMQGKQYLRLAVRNREDNDKLLDALKAELMRS